MSRLALVGRNSDALTKMETECRAAGAEDVLILCHDLAEEEQCNMVVSKTIQHYK